MNENYGYGAPERSEPRYQAPPSYGTTWNTYSWASDPTPDQLLKWAEARVKAKKRFYAHFFIYCMVIAAVWIAGIVSLVEDRGYQDMAAIYAPLFITIVWGIGVVWNYFNAFILNTKSHQERVQEELKSLLG